jgi:hypothetical protein
MRVLKEAGDQRADEGTKRLHITTTPPCRTVRSMPSNRSAIQPPSTVDRYQPAVGADDSGGGALRQLEAALDDGVVEVTLPLGQFLRGR